VAELKKVGVTEEMKTHITYRMAFATLIVGWALTLSGTAPAQSVADSEQYIPRHLLGLIHAPEVHRELRLSQGQVDGLESLFDQVDGQWWRARNLTPEENAEVILKLEKEVYEWFRTHATTEQRQRVAQLVLRSQGTRMLLRDDVKRELGLSSSQSKSIFDLAVATQETQAVLQKATRQNSATDEMRVAFEKAQQAEQQVFSSVLKADQITKLRDLIGPDFDTKGLKRVFPRAPELIASEHWLNSKPLTLKELRGKVVLLHFYAFQCHNCKANFDVYRRWHERYGDQVVVIGIQTPETALERDPLAVSQAAGDENLEFPILIDLESANWKNWANTMWPTVYVIDQNGYLRQWWQGELRWQGATGDAAIEAVVRELLETDE
jgi:thiol-disulfide isomerase/thioredoxin